MQNIEFLVDGFNLYYSLNVPHLNKYKWLDIKALCRSFLRHDEVISSVKYFTAYNFSKVEKQQRHFYYNQALKSTGIEIILGRYKIKSRYCSICGTDTPQPEEKETDVNLALHLLVGAMTKSCDKSIIITGDSDFVPAIKMVKKHFPSHRVGVIIPIGRFAVELENVPHFSDRLTVERLRNAQFSDNLKISEFVVLTRPPSWR
jgi:uncharacterized LabA/DUF88 family protein